jgi:hypothetical protein
VSAALLPTARAGRTVIATAANLKFPGGNARDPMTFEFAVPGDWSPGLALAFAELMEKAMGDGFPIVVPVRKDATPEQISQVFEGARALVERLGLAAAQAENRDDDDHRVASPGSFRCSASGVTSSVRHPRNGIEARIISSRRSRAANSPSIRHPPGCSGRRHSRSSCPLHREFLRAGGLAGPRPRPLALMFFVERE